MTRHNNRWLLGIPIALALLAVPAVAAEPDEIRQKIAEQNEKIVELEREIARYQNELEDVGKEKETLEGALKTLDLSRQRLAADIQVTERRISTTNLELSRLSLEIDDKNRRIGQNEKAVAESLRRINEIESDSLVETLLAKDNLTEFWDEVETLRQVQTSMREDAAELATLKETLEDRRAESERRKRELVNLKAQLADQKRVLDIARKEKNELLAATKNRESEYKKILDERLKAKEAFERELLAYESELRIAIDPSSIPPVGAGVLAWPLDIVKITQHFGNTSFASQNPQVYNGKGHNGIDLRAPIGTRIKAALSGSVTATGDTDLICPRASYGKWVLVKHGNGLSTLYAHLSLIRVGPGEAVSTGDTIGYSGNTGYSTGPHLHFTVYATQGVQVAKIPSRVCRGTYTIPIADFRGYLNPLSYL